MHLNPNRYLTGVFFIDARGSELNNLGQDKSAGTKNIIRTKALVRDGVQVPFRSGEAIRRDIREALAREHPDTPMSPLERAGKVTVTAADPVAYYDDDVFGYMRKPRGEEGVTRTSPLRIGKGVGIHNVRPELDWHVMSRQEGDANPFQSEFYSNILEVPFALALDGVGRFWSHASSGEEHYNETRKKDWQDSGESVVTKTDWGWELPLDERMRRCQRVVAALPFLHGGARQAASLTDTAPIFLIAAIHDAAVMPFMHLVKRDARGTGSLCQVEFDTAVEDYSDRRLSPVRVGKRGTRLSLDTECLSVREACEKLCADIENVMRGDA